MQRCGRGAAARARAALLLLGATAAACPGSGPSCGAVLESDETRIRRSLERAELRAVELGAREARLELERLRFDDVVASVEGRRASVVAMVTAEGRVAWEGGQATLAYVGRERFHMSPCARAGWCGEPDELAGLRAVLLALLRADAAERQAEPGHGGARVVGWQIRLERDSAEVGEDREIATPGAGSRRERRLHRLARERGGWEILDPM